MVTSWILNYLSPDLRDSLQYINNAKELWDELEDRYNQTNGCKLYQLQKEINDLVQGNLDITGYYTKVKKLWEEMSTIDVASQCTCVCNCGGKTRMHKAEQDRRLIHFLMGLNELYTAIRGNILMMSVLPSMAQAFAILSQEERQKEVKPHNNIALESTPLSASTTHNNTGPKGFKTNYNSYKGSASNSNTSNTSNMFRGSSSTGNRSNLFCEFCKRSGHTKDRCYKLHGYPSGQRFPKGRGSGSAANVHTSEEEKNHCEDTSDMNRQMPVNLSKDQYEQLLNLLGTLQAGHETDNPGSMLNSAVNLAGASHHMTYNKTTLKNIQTLPYPFLITLPNGYKGPSLKSPLELGRAKNGLYFLSLKCRNCFPPSDGNTISDVTTCFSNSQPISSLVNCEHLVGVVTP
ncbi:hypothetical protein KY289_002151 [Solanum tuberosum]|nr:hypothetical protein KY289_002151 [Solanum tuberosum]